MERSRNISRCRLLIIFASSVLIFSGCGNARESDVAEGSVSSDEWKMLFEGDSVVGWRSTKSDGFPGDVWKLEAGLLMGSGKGGDIITLEQYGEFELEWEWKMITKGGNSGLKYFVKEYTSGDSKQWLGLEYQILDDENFSWMLDGRMKPGDYRTLASLYEIYPAKEKTARPVGEWNSSRIVSHGKQVEHWLNGSLVLRFERGGEDFKEKVRQSKFAAYENFGESAEGHILIQDHGSEMAFRNMRIRRLPGNHNQATK